MGSSNQIGIIKINFQNKICRHNFSALDKQVGGSSLIHGTWRKQLSVQLKTMAWALEELRIFHSAQQSFLTPGKFIPRTARPTTCVGDFGGGGRRRGWNSPLPFLFYQRSCINERDRKGDFTSFCLPSTAPCSTWVSWRSWGQKPDAITVKYVFF